MAQDNETDKLRGVLFSPGRDDVPVAYVEQYKLYLTLLDKISERRQTANSFFLSINTGVCALIGYVFSKDASPDLRPLLWCVPVAGVLLSYFWFRLVRSYRDLNSAKFSVVHLIEERLPLAPYKAEWLALGEGKDPNRYTPFSHLEIWIPRSFMAMYFGLFCFFLPWTHIFLALAKLWKQHW
jgi:hypothetical protein